MNSRALQNYLHIVGIVASTCIILGAVTIGAGNFVGILIMIVGAILQRVTSEIEFRKQTGIVGEKMEILAKYLVKKMEKK